jgi:hypothetical protein
MIGTPTGREHAEFLRKAGASGDIESLLRALQMFSVPPSAWLAAHSKIFVTLRAAVRSQKAHTSSRALLTNRLAVRPAGIPAAVVTGHYASTCSLCVLSLCRRQNSQAHDSKNCGSKSPGNHRPFTATQVDRCTGFVVERHALSDHLTPLRFARTNRSRLKMFQRASN